MERIRGFEVVSKYEKDEVKMPTRATSRSAGYDFYLPEDIFIEPGDVLVVPLKVKAYMQEDELLYLHQRSSLTKYRLRVANAVGLIDSDYYNNEKNEGELLVLIHNYGKQLATLPKGERIAQGVFQKYLKVDNDQPLKKVRTGGYGSTGKE